MAEESSGDVMVRVSDLSKRYGNILAVNKISFEVHTGEVLGILGPNGAGKSTTMKILTDFIPADDGEIVIAGFDIRGNSQEIRKRIGYLPESAPLYHDISTIEYLQYVGKIRHINKALLPKKIDEVIFLCGLDKMAYRLIGKLSKGYRQRVGLAQTMLHDPDILILDEPTVGLDPNQIIEIRQLIKKIGKKKTVILSTHILPEVEATCNRVIIINNGTLVADGTTEQLIGRARNSGEKIVCEIRGNASEIEDQLSRISGVEDVKRKDEKINQLYQFEVIPAANSDPREDIFYAVSKNGWSMIELRREGIKLEDVFAQLTQGE